VDVEKQCGVFDSEKGTRCARSLTCKSHSMSAKRAVPGRSQPYDVLLGLWQRKNQVKTATTQKIAVLQEAEDVDSEEEVRLVMQGVMKRYARPIEQRCIVGVRRKIRGLRMFEGLKGALIGAVQNVAGSGVGRGRRQSQAAETWHISQKLTIPQSRRSRAIGIRKSDDFRGILPIEEPYIYVALVTPYTTAPH
jgi:hypothetical protein